MGKAINEALAIAETLHHMVTELETGLRLANELETKRAVAEREERRRGKPVVNIDQLDPAATHRQIAELLDAFIVPAWAKINKLHRLQGKCFRLEDK
jgi:hypothetical protein